MVPTTCLLKALLISRPSPSYPSANRSPKAAKLADVSGLY